MIPRRRRLGLLLLLPLVLLASCRSYVRFPGVSAGDMRAAASMFMLEQHDKSFPPHGNDVDEWVAGYTESSPGLVLFFVIVTAAMLIPFEEYLEVAVRSDGEGGSELAVEAARHWQLLFFVPMWLHDDELEKQTREGILARVEQQKPDQAGAVATVTSMIAAVRAGDEERFRDTLWVGRGSPARDAARWLADGAFWSVERSTSELRIVQVSWPPHGVTGPGASFFGIGGEPVRYDALWVVVRMGQVQRRFQVVRANGWSVALPLNADGTLLQER